MKVTSLIATLAIILTASISQAQTIDDITIYTEEYPPYNFSKDGKVVGIATEVLDHAFKKYNTKKSTDDIIITDWNIAYNNALKGPNKMAYVMIKTPLREKQFKWAGPIAITTVDVIVSKNRNFEINTIDDLKKYKVAVIKDDVGHSKAKEIGLIEKELNIQPTAQAIFAELESGRADIFLYGKDTGLYLMEKAGIGHKYEDVLNIHKSAFYAGFSLDVADNIVDSIQEVIDELKSTGELDKIMQKYAQ